jgi:hypothetical protein
VKDASPPFLAGERPPKAVAWLHPLQLLRTSYHVWLSTTAKEFIDRRETVAALDRAAVPRESYPVCCLAATTTYDAKLPDEIASKGVWIDFLADIGDSWNATYATTKLIVKPTLTLPGQPGPLPAASAVVIGGDLVYPTPSRSRYRLRTRSALVAARPGVLNGGPGTNLLVIPGNHDWYDGLTNFVREFCQGGRIGGWFMMQRRSYFAVKLMQGWWLWGIDIALDTRIDPPQHAYFMNIVRARPGQPQEFAENDNVILCTAKPAWLDDGGHEATEARRNLSFFIREVVEKHGGCVRVILSGDVHHYSRYENQAGDQLITAGGAGAYLSGTHTLPRRVADLFEDTDRAAREGRQPNPADAFRAADFPYPSRSDSRWLAMRAMLLALRPANWPFAAYVGCIYWMFAWTLILAERKLPASEPHRLLDQPLRQLVRLPVELALTPSATFAYFLAIAILASTVMLAAAGNRTSSRVLTVLWGALHGFAHMVLAMVLAWQIHRLWSTRLASFLPFGDRAEGIVFAAELITIGGFVGATVVGVYLVVSDMVFGWHTNEVFAAQSIPHYRNFLRMFLDTDGTLRIFPIGLRRTPRKWRYARERADHAPYYEETDLLLAPHLIEGPLTVTRRNRPRRDL